VTRGEPLAAALARLYALALRDDPGDLDLYLALVERTGGPVLELAAGTGRLAVPLAEAGHRVVGVDIDPAMLDRARAAAADAGVGDRLELVTADARTVRLPEAGSFRLAFIGLGSILLLDARADQQAVIRTLADHLAPGGLAVVDAWLPDADDLGRYDGRLGHEWLRTDPDTGETVSKTTAAVHDAATGTVRLTVVFDAWTPGGPVRRWAREDRLRLTGADELAAFAEAAGLEVETVAGGHDLEPLRSGAERVVLVARRPGRATERIATARSAER
jgi:SAM-dependent methyltransferase